MLLRHQQVGGGPYGPGPGAVLRKQKRRAAGEYQAGVWRFAAQAKNRIAGVSFAFGRDGATVDTDNISPGGAGAFHAAQTLPCFTQGLGFVLIDLTAECDQKKIPDRHGEGVRKSACLDKRSAGRLGI